MRPVSARWNRAVRGSHTMTARATVLSTFQTGTAPTGGTVIPIYGGAVKLDGTAAIRSTLDLTTAGSLWPTRANSILAPYGNEIFVERGVVYGNGTTEWVSLGYFRIQSPEQRTAPDGPIRPIGQDRMVGIIDGRLLAPRQYQPSQTYGAVVADLIGDIYPSATIQWDDTTNTQTIGRSIIVEQDRYAGLNDVVTSRGKICYWDYRGILVIKDVPAPNVIAFRVNAGRDGVLIEAARHLTRDGVHNAVVATGEAPDQGAPARGVAVDNNPNSPTYFYGRFGKVPRYYSSPLLLTDAAAKKAATTLLSKELGLPYSVDLSMVPNAALEPFDAVAAQYSDRGGAETHILETLTVPLVAAGAMTATTREQAYQIVGTL